ncbi:predicted protein [Plenodomus lingam JN3]|uniref:Predicted protein n=1 Tax=Leptosphaeria maculans (strain JN3 / isolate v23.1.3 / race Av1-4-5-6-7-8) TaxID=985895 RepID=E4ZH44_LEPMJ|nr:predicted protein [Plenodomus lingam JN3]CBX90614.1 predicted protein [Plenodomus lingam JN3]
MTYACGEDHSNETVLYDNEKTDIDMSSSSDGEEMEAEGPNGEEADLDHAQQGRPSTRKGVCCERAKAGPLLVNYESDEENSINMTEDNKIDENDTVQEQDDISSPLPIQHRNSSITPSNILSPTGRRAYRTPQSLSPSISPTHAAFSSYSDPASSSTICKRASNFTHHHTLPTIRRVIAQQGNQARVEYYPQWISRAWLKNNTPASVWSEWKEMKHDEESVLSYLPLTAQGYSPLRSASCSASLSGSKRNRKGQLRRESCADDQDSDQDENMRVAARPWKVLRSEVSNDNDSGFYLAAMLEETVQRAVSELSSRKMHDVLSSPVAFMPGSGSKRRAAELMGRNGLELDIHAFLRHLARLSAKERRKFEGVKVRWMGQVDGRVKTTEGRKHGVSAVSYVAPVCEGWENPLNGMKASDYFRHMARNSTTGRNDDDKDDDADDETSEYTTLLQHKRLLTSLLTNSPWLLSTTSHLTALAWLLIPRRQLKAHFHALGIHLPDDWHNYQREQYLCRYSEVVEDKRTWHDLMETSLFLNKHFKELKMAERGEKDEWITDDEGDSDVEDEHPCAGVTAANMRKSLKKTADERKHGQGKTSAKGKKQTASGINTQPTYSRRKATVIHHTNDNNNDNDDDDDFHHHPDTDTDTEYDTTHAAADATTTTDSSDPEPPPRPRPRPSKKLTPTRPLSIKSASSKAPRRAALVDPDAVRLGKRARAAANRARAVAAKKKEVEEAEEVEVDRLTGDEWRVLRAWRAGREGC